MLEGKVVIVTGAGSGMGRLAAQNFARQRAKVVVADLNVEAAEQVAEEIRGSGGEAIAVRVDVSRSDEVEAMVEKTLGAFGRIDVLINNAGICPFLAKAEEIRESGWDKVMNVNLKGVFLCSQAVGRVMIKQGGGKIINMSSVEGFLANPGSLPYAVSKAGVINMTQALAWEWGKYNINVNAIAPGFVGAGMNQQIVNIPEIREKMNERIPLGRPATAQDVVNCMLFLASSNADYITGETIVVDGGYLGYNANSLASLLGKC